MDLRGTWKFHGGTEGFSVWNREISVLNSGAFGFELRDYGC